MKKSFAAKDATYAKAFAEAERLGKSDSWAKREYKRLRREEVEIEERQFQSGAQALAGGIIQRIKWFFLLIGIGLSISLLASLITFNWSSRRARS
jgi:hypothetical protein